MEVIYAPFINVIRRFNRFYTNILGLLDQMLSSEFSLSEARVMYEIEHTADCTAKKLIETLSIDPGYLSRIIKRFEKRSFTYRIKSSQDGRLYYIFLTDKGKNVLTKLDELSDHQIYQMINTLSEQDKLRISNSMEIIENALSSGTYRDISTITLRNELKPGDVGWLIHLHGWIYAKECGYNHVFEGYVCKTFYEFFQDFHNEKDSLWFAEANGEIIGAIAIIGHTDTMAQLRWFIIHPEFRGIGLGNKLLNEAMEYCKNKGYTTVFLETTSDQATAIRLYEKVGFKKVREHESNTWGKPLIEQTYECIRK